MCTLINHAAKALSEATPMAVQDVWSQAVVENGKNNDHHDLMNFSELHSDDMSVGFNIVSLYGYEPLKNSSCISTSVQKWCRNSSFPGIVRIDYYVALLEAIDLGAPCFRPQRIVAASEQCPSML